MDVADASASVAGLAVQCCLHKPFDLDQLATALDELHLGEASEVCSSCGANKPTHVLRLFEPERPNGNWHLCDQCWKFLEVGFQAHRPDEDVDERLRATVSINAVEARGWIQTGLRQVGRNP